MAYRKLRMLCISSSSIVLTFYAVLGFVTVSDFRNNGIKLFPQRKLSSFEFASATCQPVKKIAFLKMHKCASTTIQNILLRYSHLSDLNVVLPLERWNYLGSPERFSRKLVTDTPWNSLGYDVMTLHTRWNQSEVGAILGGGATFTTILRDPVDLFESMYGYYPMRENYGNLTIEQFIEKLDDKNFTQKNNRYLSKIGRNQMMFDMGFDEKDFENETKVIEFVDEATNNFHLVMMREKFTESIVLLKELLCWSYEDVSYLKLNSRKESTVKTLTEDQKKKLKKWLNADVSLYDRFRDIFDKRLDKFGRDRMEEEKTKLEKVTKAVIENCLSSNQTVTPAPEKLLKVMMARPGCRLFALSEYDFLDEVKASQKRRADKAALTTLKGIR